ncbi:MAG: hypothetical protein RTU30_01740 [Candidatus Thorarchaeota archaeon]
MESAQDIAESISTAAKPEEVIKSINWTDELTNSEVVQQAIAKRIVEPKDRSDVGTAAYWLIVALEGLAALLVSPQITEAIFSKARLVRSRSSGGGYETSDGREDRSDAADLVDAYLRALLKTDVQLSSHIVLEIVSRCLRSYPERIIPIVTKNKRLLKIPEIRRVIDNSSTR